MAKKKKVTLLKKKKLWFPVLAPEVFGAKELGEITAFDSKELPGRTIELAYSTMTGNPKDSTKKFVVEISAVKNDKAETKFKKIVYSSSYVQRVSKRLRDRLLIVEKVPVKDGAATVKMYIFSKDRLDRSLKTQLQKKTKDWLTSQLNSITAGKLFEPGYLESLLKELKNELKALYPVSQIRPWKVLIN